MRFSREKIELFSIWSETCWITRKYWRLFKLKQLLVLLTSLAKVQLRSFRILLLDRLELDTNMMWFTSRCSTVLPMLMFQNRREACSMTGVHPYVFIGYDSKTKEHKLYDPSNKKLIMSREVQFDENKSWNWSREKLAAIHSYMLMKIWRSQKKFQYIFHHHRPQHQQLLPYHSHILIIIKSKSQNV